MYFNRITYYNDLLLIMVTIAFTLLTKVVLLKNASYYFKKALYLGFYIMFYLN